jgi:hypothetical protein
VKGTKPDGLWDQLLRKVNSWLDDDLDDDEEQASEDPSLVFHLMLTAPLVIGFLVIVRRTTL